MEKFRARISLLLSPFPPSVARLVLPDAGANTANVVVRKN